MFGIEFMFEGRKPQLEWRFEDNKVTGICSWHSLGGLSGHPLLILPYGLSDDQRDVVLWAYECGVAAGRNKERDFISGEVKRYLGVRL